MTQDEIIEMAEKSRVAFSSDEYPEIWQTYMHVGKKELETFAKLVAAKEREACAKVCEQQEDYGPLCETIWDCAAAIRARGEA